MAGSTFGNIFKITTWGESHGKGVGVVVDGCPAGLSLCEEDIQKFLNRRKPGQSKFTTPRKEDDSVEILSGVFEGKTTGTPISLVVYNKNQQSKDYSEIASYYRPGHADYTYLAKYGIRDYRGGGRASARETAMRVAAGAVAKKVLNICYGIEIRGAVSAIGEISSSVHDCFKAYDNEFNFIDESKLDELKALFKELAVAGDSVGAVVEVQARGVPAGWGSPVFDRLDAQIAYAMMGINAVKGVEIGDGFALASMRGSKARDEIVRDGFLSNHAGGILGGISSGQKISVRMALKPTSSILVPGRSLNRFGEEVSVVTHGRHDPCVGIRAVPIAEAMLALCLVDAAMQQSAQCLNKEESSLPIIPAGID